MSPSAAVGSKNATESSRGYAAERKKKSVFSSVSSFIHQFKSDRVVHEIAMEDAAEWRPPSYFMRITPCSVTLTQRNSQSAPYGLNFTNRKTKYMLFLDAGDISALLEFLGRNADALR